MHVRAILFASFLFLLPYLALHLIGYVTSMGGDADADAGPNVAQGLERYLLVDADEASAPADDFVAYRAVKYEMDAFVRRYRVGSSHAPLVSSGKGKEKARRSGDVNAQVNRAISAARVPPTMYDGTAAHELPVMQQGMCGSCWAISAATALKANVGLRKLGMKRAELPNLNHMIACSRGMSQIVNDRNADAKLIIEFGPERTYSGGCLGGLSGMALSLLQISKGIGGDNVYTAYRAGETGTLEPEMPVTADTSINYPGVTCAEATDRLRAAGDEQRYAVNTSRLDMQHVPRPRSSGGVHFPLTSHVRRVIHEFGAVIIYVDTDSGLNQKELVGQRNAVQFPPCKWATSDFYQSDESDGHSISIFGKADHAVVLVGWDCARSAWKVQNSWGVGWGDSGSLWMYDPNVCADGAPSGVSGGAGPACMFASTLSVFTHA